MYGMRLVVLGIVLLAASGLWVWLAKRGFQRAQEKYTASLIEKYGIECYERAKRHPPQDEPHRLAVPGGKEVAS